MTQSSIAFSDDIEIEAKARATGNANTTGDPSRGLIAFRSAPPDWLGQRLSQIDHLRMLGQNWDSYGGSPIDLRSIALAKSVLKELSFVDTLDAPVVTAAPSGHVAFCWDLGDRSLDLEVLPNGTIKFVYLNANDERKDLEGITADLFALAKLWTQW